MSSTSSQADVAVTDLFGYSDSDVYLANRLFASMAFVRRFEEVAQALFQRGNIYGSIHLCMGQEAVPIGVCSALRPGDVVAATYRGHGQVLAMGVEPYAFMAELLGRQTGVCGGRAGSMNVVAPALGLIGCFGIVGGSMAAATGAGLTHKTKESGNVSVAFFGDGTANHGYFHESLNFAATHALPVLFVCENNGYGEFTPTAAVTPGGIPARPRALGIYTQTVDGQDVWAVRAAAQLALDHVRSGAGPAFLEVVTYRFNGHARGDPINYRPDGELEAWKARDPLVIARRHLAELGVAESIVAKLESVIDLEVSRVRDTALQDPFPDVDSLSTVQQFPPAKAAAVTVEGENG
jgi:TPP-dependent pyruvate/acetoin dehydrogenase alpha subunit